jgi:hypothetical protein
MQGYYKTPSQVLVVPSQEMDAGQISSIIEDMSVMSRILSEDLGNKPARMGVLLGAPSALPFGGGTWPQGIYLQGYGALFLAKADFPLAAPAAAQPQQEQPGPQSRWERTRQSMYAPPVPPGSAAGGFGPGFGPMSPSTLVVPQFDQAGVDKLKDTILHSLKEASNISSLKPDDSVAVVVLGEPAPGGAAAGVVTSTFRAPANPLALPRTPGVSAPSVSFLLAADGSPTVLTIAVKKSEVDAFAADRLTLEEFRRLAVITAY